MKRMLQSLYVIDPTECLLCPLCSKVWVLGSGFLGSSDWTTRTIWVAFLYLGWIDGVFIYLGGISIPGVDGEW